MASRRNPPVNLALEAWLRTDVGLGLSPIKRRNYFKRLLAWVAYDVRRWWPIWDNLYDVALLRTADVPRFLRGVTEFARTAAQNDAIFLLGAWCVSDAERAWVFLESGPWLDGWTDGEHWIEGWSDVEDEVVWVEWAGSRGVDSLRCRWDEQGVRREFMLAACPPPQDFDFPADDSAAMRALLATGPMGVDATELANWLRLRNAAGEVEVRRVPLVFESMLCGPILAR
ncbi:MAG: hypothetical protein V4850_23040 [Myxococcota bacterium]